MTRGMASSKAAGRAGGKPGKSKKTSRPRYEMAWDLHALATRIIHILELDYIDPFSLYCVRSYGSKTDALARIWGLDRIFQEAAGLKPIYVIEFVSPRFDRLPPEEKEKTIIHELMHIPKTFSGALVSHKQFGKWRITSRTVGKVYSLYKERLNALELAKVNPPA